MRSKFLKQFRKKKTDLIDVKTNPRNTSKFRVAKKYNIVP